MQIAYLSLCRVNKKRFVRCVCRSNGPHSLHGALLQLVNQFQPDSLSFRHEWFNGPGNIQAEDEGGEFVGGECV
jgi:hypothetical protein